MTQSGINKLLIAAILCFATAQTMQAMGTYREDFFSEVAKHIAMENKEKFDQLMIFKNLEIEKIPVQQNKNMQKLNSDIKETQKPNKPETLFLSQSYEDEDMDLEMLDDTYWTNLEKNRKEFALIDSKK